MIQKNEDGYYKYPEPVEFAKLPEYRCWMLFGGKKGLWIALERNKPGPIRRWLYKFMFEIEFEDYHG